ncbi:MAG TPA: hypothetical protein DCG34_06470 [Clostridiales bacterium]|jgi:hypothetical protein|nr:hypothetical protein [Clostridiales bacterium]
MLKRFVLVAICLIVLSGCAKKPSPTGGTVMSSGEIAFFYAPGWVIEKEDGYWRFEHPSATAWGVVQVIDDQNQTDGVVEFLERELDKRWGGYSVVNQEDVDIQGRSVRRIRYRLNYYMKPFSACGMYYGGPEGTVVVVTYVMSDQEWAIQKDMDNFMKGIAFKK